jgi:hypothetical protein
LRRVASVKGEGAGELKDLVIDTTSGRVQHTVRSFGGRPGIGDKLFAPTAPYEPDADLRRGRGFYF